MTGRVALLEPVPKAVVKALVMLAMNLNGRVLVTTVNMIGRAMNPCTKRPRKYNCI